MVYLLHLEPAFRHARHYLGATSDPNLAALLASSTVPILDVPILVAARAAGSTLTVARTWTGGERERARLRSQKSAQQFCPTCQRLEQVRRRS